MADIEITARDLKNPGKSRTLQVNKSMAMEDLRNLVREADPAWNQEYLSLYLEDEQQRLPLSFVSELKDGDLLMVEAINKDAPPIVVDEFWPYRHRHRAVGSLLIVIGTLLLVGGLLWAYKATNNTWWILGNPPERNPTDYPYPFWVFMGTYFAIGYLSIMVVVNRTLPWIRVLYFTFVISLAGWLALMVIVIINYWTTDPVVGITDPLEQCKKEFAVYKNFIFAVMLFPMHLVIGSALYFPLLGFYLHDTQMHLKLVQDKQSNADLNRDRIKRYKAVLMVFSILCLLAAIIFLAVALGLYYYFIAEPYNMWYQPWIYWVNAGAFLILGIFGIVNFAKSTPGWARAWIGLIIGFACLQVGCMVGLVAQFSSGYSDVPDDKLTLYNNSFIVTVLGFPIIILIVGPMLFTIAFMFFREVKEYTRAGSGYGEELTVYGNADEPVRPRREREIVSPWKIMKLI